jgi:glyoxylate reductase
LYENSAHDDWSSLSSIADIIEPKARSRDEFIKECKSGAFDKVVATYRTFQSVAITGLIDEELIAALPKGMKYIAHNGTQIFHERRAAADVNNRSRVRSNRY